MANDDFLLNETQQKAMEQTEGYVRVIAGAGSGKTRTLSMRFAWLVEQLGIMPSSILCMTFTNKAAAEMRTRIRSLIGDDDTGTICTFHGLCNTILLEESHLINYPKSFMVLDASDIDDMLKIVYEEKGLGLRDMTFSKAREMLEMKKIAEYPGYTEDLIHLSSQQLYQKYEQAKSVEDQIFFGYLLQQKKNFALDYDDLIILTLKIFREHPDVAKKWQERFEYIMIDEFQDIDPQQYELMEVLARGHQNLFVVGDPDQTIYTWRGARVEFLTQFDSNFPGTNTIFLNENYRSTPQILDAANSLIAKNQNRIKKELVPILGDGAQVHAGHFEDANKEAGQIAANILHLKKKGYSYKDMAILYRAHYISRPIEDALIEAEIPYSIYSGVPFFSRMEIKDAISWCRMLVYQDDIDFLRTINRPRRNIGKGRIAFLQEYAREKGISLYKALKENLETDKFKTTQAAEYVSLIDDYPWQEKSITRILDEILDFSGYEKMLRLEGGQERLDNLAELKQAAAEYEMSWGEDTNLEGWLNHAALFSNADAQTDTDKVRLMTIHTAKGLEFDCVFLPGLNEGMFPSRQTRNLAGMEEERRLAFVALTRARKELYLSEAQGQLHTGSSRYPSRFVFDIGLDHATWNPSIPKDLQDAAKRMIGLRKNLLPQSEGQEALEAGDLVEHPVFGQGIILEINPDKQAITVQFDKLNTQRTLSTRVRLKKIGRKDPETWLN